MRESTHRTAGGDEEAFGSMLVGGRGEELMEESRQRHAQSLLIVLALVLHLGSAAGLNALAKALERHNERPRNLVSEVEIEARPPPPPPPAPAPPPEVAHAPEPEPVRPIEHHVTREPPPPPPPPAPTQAAPIMTVAEEFSNDNQEVVAVGNNVNATGDVATNGVVRGPGQGVTGARFGGTPNGTGNGPPHPVTAVAPPPDYSTRAEFRCDEDAARTEFPEAASQAGIMEMTVRLRVTVDAAGHVSHIDPSNDPGYGFVAAAMNVIRRHCEITPARDRGGAAVGDTKAYTINFVME